MASALTTSGQDLKKGDPQSAIPDDTIMTLLGEGVFGKVYECSLPKIGEPIAIKMLNKEYQQLAMQEITALQAIRVPNLVKYYGYLEHLNHRCLAFEMLDINLYKFCEVIQYEPLFAEDIRPIAKQLLVGLDALKKLGIIHADIKPDNVMLVNSKEKPFRVKLILGKHVSPLASLPGRFSSLLVTAPEVFLGLPFNEGIDVWEVGCVLTFLLLAHNLFPVRCKYQTMRSIVALLGQPPVHKLTQGQHTKNFFTQVESNGSPRWPLMTPEEYAAVNNIPVNKEESVIQLPGGMDQLHEIYPNLDDDELVDHSVMVKFLKGLVHLDPEQRMTPCMALQHPFITLSYRHEDPNSTPLEDEGVIPLKEPEEIMSGSHQDHHSDSDSGLFEQSESPTSTSEVIDMELVSEESDNSGVEIVCELPETFCNVSLKEVHDNSLLKDESSQCSVDSVRPTSSERWNAVGQRIHGFFRRIHTTLFCCCHSQTD